MSLRLPYCHLLGSLLLLWGGIIPLQAQWSMALKNVLANSHNVEILLHFNQSVETPRDVLVDVRISPPGQHRSLYQKRAEITLRGNDWFAIPLNLDQRSYDVEVELYDPLRDEAIVLHTEEEFLVNPGGSLQLSDIYLSTSPDAGVSTQAPLLSPQVPPSLDTLYVHLGILSNASQEVRVEALLYESLDSDNEGSDILVYASLNAQQQVIALRRDEATFFSEKLSIGTLSEGKYLLEITVNSNTGSTLRESIPFVIGGNLEEWVAANLDDAIRMMQYVVPVEIVEELLDFPDREAQLLAFFETWEELYRDEAILEMERYYQQIFLAKDRFAEPGKAGWETDRGRIFIEYGEPARIEPWQYKGQDYQRWYYPEWSLVFLFEVHNQTYRLVE